MNSSYLLEEVSICIPFVINSITKEYILDIFQRFNIGKIKDVVLTYNNKNRNKFALIHYHCIFNNTTALEVLKLIDDGQYFKLIYDFPHYWKCYKYNSSANNNSVYNNTHTYNKDKYDKYDKYQKNGKYGNIKVIDLSDKKNNCRIWKK